ncbi:hypothetical protein [Streptomyces sp. NPDC093089]|uniref:hypothetical protein n=1 Tax=Streptomyces sp. NPDC093089 TaxID=3366024 RepID=UPI00381F8364
MTSLRTLKAAAALATVTTALLLATTTAVSAAELVEPAGLRGVVTVVADADLGANTGTGKDDFGWQ